MIREDSERGIHQERKKSRVKREIIKPAFISKSLVQLLYNEKSCNRDTAFM